MSAEPAAPTFRNDFIGPPVNRSSTIAYCSLIMLVALYIVGAVSHGSLRHEVQTLPLWFPIVLGFRHHVLAKWVALPCFVIWLVLMTFIWLFLLGWAHVFTGHFSPTEIALTVFVGVASATGIVVSLQQTTAVSRSKAALSVALLAILQLAALRISFLPKIANQ